MDWDKLHEVLTRVEAAFRSLSSAAGINDPDIEVWRWDEPVVTLTWLGNEQIKRNIAVRALSEDEAMVEVNAWRDEDRDGGKVRVRNWAHQPIQNVKVKSFDTDLPVALRNAHQIVVGWKPSDLKSETTYQTTGSVSI